MHSNTPYRLIKGSHTTKQVISLRTQPMAHKLIKRLSNKIFMGSIPTNELLILDNIKMKKSL
jgi:hypothetical protein